LKCSQSKGVGDDYVRSTSIPYLGGTSATSNSSLNISQVDRRFAGSCRWTIQTGAFRNCALERQVATR